MSARHASRVTAPAIAAALALTLLGCQPGGPTPGPSASTPVGESPSPAGTTPAAEPSPTETTPSREVVVANVRDAVTSGDTAALASWMADDVDFALAATEYGGTFGPEDAATWIHDTFPVGTTWDFDLDESIVADYADGDYATWFPPTVIVGRTVEDDPMVIAITIPSDRITGVLIAIEDVLYF